MKATFAAGCFWGVEAAFKKIKGVVDTTVGYTGGTLKDPSYEEVCAHKTGHVEAVEVEYDPKKVSYEKLLEVFWMIHDPMQDDGQGPDVGPQYMAIIFFHNDEQKKLALNSKKKIEEEIDGKIATSIRKNSEFYPAEDYHQDYLDKNENGYCHIDLNLIK